MNETRLAMVKRDEILNGTRPWYRSVPSMLTPKYTVAGVDFVQWAQFLGPVKDGENKGRRACTLCRVAGPQDHYISPC